MAQALYLLFILYNLSYGQTTFAPSEHDIVHRVSTTNSVGRGFWHFFYNVLKPCGPLRHNCRDDDEGDEYSYEDGDSYGANDGNATYVSTAYGTENADGVSATGGDTLTGSGNDFSGFSSSSSFAYWIFIVGAIIGLGVALKVSEGFKKRGNASSPSENQEGGHGLVQNRVSAWKSYFKSEQDNRNSIGRGIEMSETGESKIDFVRVTDDVL